MSRMALGNLSNISTSLRSGGICVLRFNKPRKLNAWSLPMLNQFNGLLQQAKDDPEVKAVLVTGTGRYYSAGVDLTQLLRPMLPGAFVESMTDLNEKLFGQFIDFPKPIFAALNGPSVGAASTSAFLMDDIFCNKSASFHTPFATLGLVPEGCSSYMFPKLFGDQLSTKLLEEGYKLGADEALAKDAIVRVVDSAYDAESEEEDKVLISAAEEHIRCYLATGGSRKFTEEERQLLRKVNRAESIALANAFVSEKFLQNMEMTAKKRGNNKAKLTFRTLRFTRPIWSLLL